MGLLDEISALNSADREAAVEQMLQSATIRQEILAIRRQVVTDAVKAFATKYGCPWRELNLPKVGRYFLVDDLVLQVQEQVFLDPDTASTTKVNEVLWQHFVYLVGLDITSRTRHFKVGTLRMLTLEGIRKSHNQNIGCEFSQSKIMPILFQA